jgi:hypothetical protein
MNIFIGSQEALDNAGFDLKIECHYIAIEKEDKYHVFKDRDTGIRDIDIDKSTLIKKVKSLLGKDND